MTDPPDRLTAALADRYRIRRKLGEGGMASVYLAEDVRHERNVALKVLRPELAAVLGADRFLAEIKTTANLQHPHILPLFDSGEADGFLYYVMPFIEGETLRGRIEREGQLGVEEAVRIARDVADALDYAHRNDIIHRDIKPANILLHDGRPVVADFGIALAISAAGGGRMTETGLSLGTPHYMSPEQASADRDLTARSDVYSLGCVLYEMLAGQPPHTGPSAQNVLVRILTEDPRDVTELRRTVPPHVAAAVMKSIEKLPADRFDTARAFKDALEDPTFTHAVVPRRTIPSGAGPVTASVRESWLSDTRSRVAVGMIAVLALLAVQAWVRGGSTGAVPQPPVRATLPLDPDRLWNWRNPRISADGSRMALMSDAGVMVRDAGQADFQLLPGTEGAQWGEGPAFSPDGQWIAFVREGALYKAPLSGSSPLTLVREAGIVAEDPDWGDDGTIVFESSGSLWRVSETGGDAEKILTLEVGVAQNPDLLPGGVGVLFTGEPTSVALLDLSSGEWKRLVEEGVSPRYVPTGHILYVHPEGGLFALPFDLEALEATGDPVPVSDEIRTLASAAHYHVADNGTLIFGTGSEVTNRRRLLVLSPDGTVDSVRLAPQAIAPQPRFAPDGRRIAFNSGGGIRTDERQVYVYDLGSERLQQLTFEGGHRPVWSPDGAWIVFSSEGPGTDAEDLWMVASDGASLPRHILRLPADQHAYHWPADSSLLFGDQPDVFRVNPWADSAVAEPYLAAEYGEADAEVSADGRFAAYASTETGRTEIFVRGYPDPLGKWRISESGGGGPAWSRDGRSLYYLGSDGESILRTGLQEGSSPAPLRTETAWSVPRLAGWDLDRSTGRALVLVDDEGSDLSDSVVWVVVNWFEELRRLTGAGR